MCFNYDIDTFSTTIVNINRMVLQLQTVCRVCQNVLSLEANINLRHSCFQTIFVFSVNLLIHRMNSHQTFWMSLGIIHFFIYETLKMELHLMFTYISICNKQQKGLCTNLNFAVSTVGQHLLACFAKCFVVFCCSEKVSHFCSKFTFMNFRCFDFMCSFFIQKKCNQTI